MLVLSRKVGEEIIVDGNIRITVVAVRGGRIRIGITAPRDVSVDRAEIHRIKLENRNARIPGSDCGRQVSAEDIPA